MKLAVISFVAAGLILLGCSLARAGGVQIALLTFEQKGNWLWCGGPQPAEKSKATYTCDTAKYGEISSCPALVITNHSSEPVKIQVQLTGAGFELPPRGGSFSFGVMATSDGQKCAERVNPSCERLAPGESCDAEIEFSPEHSGNNRGHLEVLVTGSGDPVSKTFELVAVGDYPPELKAIDEVIQRHKNELMGIPHVVRIAISDFHENTIQVEVAHQEDISKVERQVPSRLEGYPVDVIEQIERGWGY